MFKESLNVNEIKQMLNNTGDPKDPSAVFDNEGTLPNGDKVHLIFRIRILDKDENGDVKGFVALNSFYYPNGFPSANNKNIKYALFGEYCTLPNPVKEGEGVEFAKLLDDTGKTEKVHVMLTNEDTVSFKDSVLAVVIGIEFFGFDVDRIMNLWSTEDDPDFKIDEQ
jgi:hypothetical protein